jgi:hypothetical protein
MKIALTIFVFALISIPSAAFSSEGDKGLSPIYFGVMQHADGKIEVKFVFSKLSSGKPQFSPTHGFTIMPNTAQRNCNIQRANDLGIPQEYMSSPLYDPSNEKTVLPIEKLPTFFATVVSAELTRKKFTKTADESLPYHTCTRLLWEQILGLKPR